MTEHKWNRIADGVQCRGCAVHILRPSAIDIEDHERSCDASRAIKAPTEVADVVSMIRPPMDFLTALKSGRPIRRLGPICRLR